MNNEKIDWEIKLVDLSKLKPAAYNPRKTLKKIKPVFEKNLEKFGILEPIVVNQDYTIIGGHQRYQIFKEQGVSMVEVSYPSRLLSSQEEVELNVKLNSLGGKTNTHKLLLLGLSVEELQDIGYVELKIPDEKDSDKRNEIKEKNPLVYNLYYFADDFFYVKKVLAEIQKEKRLTNQADAVLYLLNL